MLFCLRPIQQSKLKSPFESFVHTVATVAVFFKHRLNLYFGQSEGELPVNFELVLPEDGSALGNFIRYSRLSPEETFLLLLSLTPHLQPGFLEAIIQQYLPNGGELIEIGGVKTGNHRGMMPTGETALFVLAGTDLQRRLEVQQLLFDSRLIKENILSLEPVKDGEPVMSGRLLLAQEWMDKIVFGRQTPAHFNADFPAKRITTFMTWDDLVLNVYTQSQLDDLMIWVQHNEAVMRDPVLRRKIKPGYRALFYGPPGTGKTLTAALIGNRFGKEVHRIDLSKMVSKYIGETEKNLEKVFARAEHRDWILFFDEADALFGKRTNVQSSHDRYANQEVSYLLQRVEDYPGLLILASNFKSNMDDAFLRRFNSIIHFPAPGAGERLRLWQNTLPGGHPPEPAVDLQELSTKYDLTGAAILNVVHYALLRSLSRTDAFIRKDDLMEGIRKEFRKEERSIN